MERRKREDRQALDDAVLADVTGGVQSMRGKYVSSFYCEVCGRTIRLSGIYQLETARKNHFQKEHRGLNPQKGL